jgi:hypothetical protein
MREWPSRVSLALNPGYGVVGPSPPERDAATSAAMTSKI